MVEKFRSRMLEVTIEALTSSRWAWQVKAGDEVVAEGCERSQIEASFEGNNALFQLLAAGWDE
jgi:hypothetical protein